ncbi:MAG: glutathione S-transferase family protein [Deltaproteobacteria bacterium]|nr:MAG: glutathione S-transferase family protein [Deltaproteobacteria bacterium]
MVTLYEFPRTRSARCRWMLQELGVPFEARRVDLRVGEHQGAAYLAVNPNGKVPALVDGDLTLFESCAICLYLGDKHPESDLVPRPGTAERALHDQWLFFCATELEQPLWRIRRHTVLYPEDKRVPAEVPVARADFEDAARVLASHLDGRDHLVGDRFTAADIVATYTLWWASVTPGLLDGWPGLVAYLQRHLARPSCPEELRPKR